jgi:FAD-dependent oxidoreductase domain-containing protein 1
MVRFWRLFINNFKLMLLSIGLQQAPAVGQAVMELISEGSYKSIDLSRFAFDRLMVGEQVLERNIV